MRPCVYLPILSTYLPILFFLFHTSFSIFQSPSYLQQQPPLFPGSNKKDCYSITFYLLPYSDALFLEFLLLLFPSHAPEESSIKPSSPTSWSAALITLLDTGLAFSLSLKGKNCVCTIRIGFCLCPCVARPTARFGEYFQAAELHTVRTLTSYSSLSVAYLEPQDKVLK